MVRLTAKSWDLTDVLNQMKTHVRNYTCIYLLNISLQYPSWPCFTISNWFLSFRFAATKRDGSCYFVLLIITDGVITDMPQTKQAIVMVSVAHCGESEKVLSVSLFSSIYNSFTFTLRVRDLDTMKSVILVVQYFLLIWWDNGKILIEMSVSIILSNEFRRLHLFVPSTFF